MERSDTFFAGKCPEIALPKSLFLTIALPCDSQDPPALATTEPVMKKTVAEAS